MDKGCEYSRVAHFCSYYRARIEFVEEECLERIEGTILLCCYLDAMAGYRFSGSSGKNRLKRFLLEYTDQADTWQKVSLILLKEHLTAKNHMFYDQMIGFLAQIGTDTDRFSNLNYNPDLSIDVFIEKAQENLKADYVNQIGADIRRFEYSEILWRCYRNPSVHETSIGIGRAVNLADKHEPYYSNQLVLNGGGGRRHITRFDIPTEFLAKTARSGLESLRRLYEKEDLLPIDHTQATLRERHKGHSPRQSDDVEIGYPRMITKPFRPLLADTGILLQMAKESHTAWKTTDDPDDRWREAALSRSCIIACAFFLEALSNSILKDFEVWDPLQLPLAMQKKIGLDVKPVDRLPLEDRVYIIPYLCNKAQETFSNTYFDRGSIDFQRMCELIRIRDRFAHSRPTKRKFVITKTGAKEYVVDDNFQENFWPVTRIPKDIFIIEFEHAQLARQIIDRTTEQLNEFLGGRIVANRWMRDEHINLKPPENDKSSG